MAQPLLATLVRRLHLTIRQRIHADLHRAGFTDLAPAHIYVFQTPGPDGMRPTELAARTNMTKQAMNHLLSFLEGAGYVTRRPAPDDGRSKVLRLTARGRRVVRVTHESARRIEQEWAAQLGARNVEALRRALVEADAVVGD
jgi:DNA-binding MarR family transcriptional regulator